jgi:glutamyl-Q tRNA(Asp) synthetase
VTFQSRRVALYEQALARLRDIYPCSCSRREIADSAVSLAADGAQVYPGTCRAGMPAGKTARAVRVRVAGTVVLRDRVQGELSQDLEREVGDFVLRRADGQFAYQLAVVVDDADQGVTDVVRGADLLESTPRQIYLQRLLGFASPRYLHVPVALDANGAKLSKQTDARGIDRGDLRRALRFLGQPPSKTLEEAVRLWDPALIPARRAAALPP